MVWGDSVSLEQDQIRGNFALRGGVVSQSSLGIQNLHQALSYDLMPLGFNLSLTGFPSLTTGLGYSSDTVNTVEAITAINAVNKEIALRVSPQGAVLTMAAPAAGQKVAVGNSDTDIIPANTARRYACLVNTSATQRITLGFGAAAVLDEGITIYPQGSYEISEAAGNLTLQDIRGIANVAGAQMSWVEGT